MLSRIYNPFRLVLDLLLLAICCGGVSVSVAQADWLEDSGLNALRALLGDDAPDGDTIAVSQVEAGFRGVAGDYIPDFSDTAFQPDANYTPPSLVNGSSAQYLFPGVSGHATNVSRTIFGKFGMAPGVDTVVMYQADHFVNNVLGLGTSAPNLDPNNLPYKVQNNSWAIDHDGTNGFGVANSLAVLRKIDYLVDKGEVTTIVGVGNQSVDPNTLLVRNPRPDHFTLLSYSFNSIAVGVSTGWHAIGETEPLIPPLTSYGNGRRKPSLVAPAVGAVGTSSTSTALVSGAAAMLHEQVAGTDADKSEVARAIIMAGATKQELMDYWDQDASSDPNDTVDWDRSTTRPLDDIFGAGELNVLNNYLIAEGGQFDGGTMAAPVEAGAHGWDYGNAAFGTSRFYEFEVPAGSLVLDFSVLLTWNAEISNFNSFDVADMDLILRDQTDTIIESSVFVNDAGITVGEFENVEHIYIGDRQSVEYLGPGTYTLEVQSSSDSRDFGLAWRTTTAYGTDPNNLFVTADFDQNGMVDAGDFLAWQRNNGTLVNATLADGDADGDGDVDQTDLNIFQNQFGSSSLPNLIGVPEPGTLVLAALAGLGLMMPGRRQRRV